MQTRQDIGSGHLAHLKRLQRKRELLSAEVKAPNTIRALDLKPPAKLPDRRTPTMRELDILAMEAAGTEPPSHGGFEVVIQFNPSTSGKSAKESSRANIENLAESAGNIYRELRQGPNPGVNASYIRALRDAPKDGGFCITLSDGTTIFSQETPSAGLSLQSASKPLAFAAAALYPAHSTVTIGAQPSPYAFNAPATLGNLLDPQALARANDAKASNSYQAQRNELAGQGDIRPANGMINLGAIAAHSNISSSVTIQPSPTRSPSAEQKGVNMDLGEFGRLHHLRKLIALMCERPGHRSAVSTDFEVYISELIDSDGNLMFAKLATDEQAPAEESGDGKQRMDKVWATYASYISACATRISLPDMAAVYHTLANGGMNRYTGKQVIPADLAAKVLEQMRVGGLYEASPAFTSETGLYAKTGVSGTGNYISPRNDSGKGADFATFSSPLDPQGNSWLGGEFVRRVRALPVFSQLREDGLA